MRIKIKVLIGMVIFSALSFSLTGCAPEEGPIGLQGPQGEQGMQGPQGPQGEQGIPGTVNVLHSDWITFDVSVWNQVTEFGRVTQLYEIQKELISEDIINSGVVLVYIRFGGSTAPRLLPVTGYVTTTTKEQHIWHRLSAGKIVLVFHNLNDTTNPGTFGNGNQYRYIIIPGGTLISYKEDGIDLQKLSYNEICKTFNFSVN